VSRTGGTGTAGRGPRVRLCLAEARKLTRTVRRRGPSGTRSPRAQGNAAELRGQGKAVPPLTQRGARRPGSPNESRTNPAGSATSTWHSANDAAALRCRAAVPRYAVHERSRTTNLQQGPGADGSITASFGSRTGTSGELASAANAWERRTARRTTLEVVSRSCRIRRAAEEWQWRHDFDKRVMQLAGSPEWRTNGGRSSQPRRQDEIDETAATVSVPPAIEQTELQAAGRPRAPAAKTVRRATPNCHRKRTIRSGKP